MHSARVRFSRLTMFVVTVFVVTVAFTAVPAVAQIIYHESINLGVNGTVNYLNALTNPSPTCYTNNGKTKVTYQINTYYSYVYVPPSGSQVSIPGSFHHISGSPGAIRGSTCPANQSGGTITFLAKNYQIYVYTGGLNAAYVPGTFGYINPKYIVASVIYAPPGSRSTAVYTNSTSVSNTTTISSSFTSSTTVSSSTQTLSGVPTPTGVFAWINGTSKNTSSTTETQQSQNSSSVTATMATSNGLTAPGPASDYVGVDHDYDLIKVWINPVMLFTVYNTGLSGETKIGWWGYGTSALDTTAPVDIWSIPVGCLNGDFPETESACAPALQAFQRPWANNENWPSGQGPGLTQTDLNTILSADPWGKCTPNDPVVSTACPTYTSGFVLPNFSLSNQSELPYTQPLPGGQPSTNSYGVSTTNAATQTSGSTVTNSQTFGYEIAQTGTGFFSGFSSTLSFAQTLTWSYAYSTSLTTSNTMTGTANITGPACVGNPCNPSYPPSSLTFGTAAAFDVFVDARFGTFAFVPAAY